MRIDVPLSLLLLTICLHFAGAFVPAYVKASTMGPLFVPPTKIRARTLESHKVIKPPQSPFHFRNTSALRATAATSSLPTLTEETTWKLSFLMQGLPTEQGRKVDEIFTINAHFIEEIGYEPPQGSLCQLSISGEKTNEGNAEAEEDTEAVSSRLKIARSRWQLSEDPNNRKDGLWVWGLFSEPLYPFLLLQLETESVPLAGNEGDSIKPLKLFAQLNHKREKDSGVTLSGGDLKVREIETIKVDFLGAATTDIYEEVSIGKLNIQPLQ